MACSGPHKNLARAGLILLWLGLYQNAMAGPATAGQSEPGKSAEQSGQFKKAATAYRQEIAKLGAAGDQYSPRLVEPLLGLGRSLVHLGDYGAATTALRRAQAILHRADGVDSLRQLEIVDLLRQVSMNEGKPLDANREARFSLYLSQHNYGDHSPDLLPAIYKISTWYIETGQYDRAHTTLIQAAKIITAHYGKRDPQMIHVLELRALNQRLQRFSSYRTLERARDIVRSNPGLPADQKAEVYTQLGDAYLADYKSKRAQAAYEQAWHLLGSPAAESRFEKPAIIPATRVLDRFRHDFVDVYTTEQDPWGNIKLDRLTSSEALALGSLPPQQYSVTGAPTRRYLITDRRVATKNIGPAQALTGSPFQFLRSQILQILPFTGKRRDASARMKIHLLFDVAADGSASNVEVSGEHIPPSVVRLMKKTVSLTRFRPRMVDGKPVATKHVRLVQTFN